MHHFLRISPMFFVLCLQLETIEDQLCSCFSSNYILFPPLAHGALLPPLLILRFPLFLAWSFFILLCPFPCCFYLLPVLFFFPSPSCGSTNNIPTLNPFAKLSRASIFTYASQMLCHSSLNLRRRF